MDLKTIPGLASITTEKDGSLKIGALATLAQVAARAGVREGEPPGARPRLRRDRVAQIRNVATIGGNLLQRPRCWYYRLESYKCFKKAGDMCFAARADRCGVLFGGGPAFAPHPSKPPCRSWPTARRS